MRRLLSLIVFLVDRARRAHLKTLERQIEWLQIQLIAERQRANVAIDRLLSEKSIAPVTLPTMDPEPVKPERPDPTADREFAAAGGILGDDF